MKRGILVALVVAALSVPAFAADAKKGGGKSYKKAYGMAGCGVGTLLIKSDTVGGQIGVWLINEVGSYFTGVLAPTWAMTTGTSNCVDRPAEVAMEQEVFVQSNLANLSKEAATGNGGHLDAFAEVLGCGQKDAFGRFSQEKYGELFKDSDPSQVLNRYLTGLKSAPEFATCKRIG